MAITEEGDLPTSADGVLASTKRLAEWTFSLQGVGADLKALVAEIKAWARTQMAHWSDRGPRDYPKLDEADELVARAARQGAYQATIEIQNYQEGGKGNGSSASWRNWVMGMLGSLIVIGLTSLIVMYATQKAQGERMEGFEHRITNLEHKVWP